MDTQKLKRVYEAARSLNGHDREQAAKEVGKSPSMIDQVLSGRATSRPTINAIRNYCYRAGLRRTIEKLGLDPDAPVRKKKATETSVSPATA